ncbi:MAG: Zn-ribbon domain-containing OB-fold protein [Candidatus Hodarchaeales archaeon]
MTGIKKPKFTKKFDYRPEGVKETGFTFVGHQISEDGTKIIQKLHYDQLYTLRPGSISKVFLGFLEGKLYGTKCPKCGDKFFPPRIHCWNLDCDIEETEWIELKQEAVVHTFTVAGWSGRSSLKRLPITLVYAVVDGCKTAVANELHGIEPWHAEFGMPLRVEWKSEDERTGSITDFHFIPASDWKPSPMNPEKERIKKLVEPVYEWVKSMK